MSNNGFEPTTFIIEVGTKSCKHLTWTTKEEGKVFTKALRENLGKSSIGSRLESKSQSSIFASVLDVLIFDFC